MEASRTPDSLFDHGTVRTLDDRLVIESLTVADARVADVVRQRAETGQPPVQTVVNAIEIGARVLEREGTAAEVDYVRAEFERAAGSLSKGFESQARAVAEALQGELDKVFDADSGLMASALEGHSEEIAEEIATHFGSDRSSAVQHQIKESVSKLVEEQLNKLVRHFASDDATNPFADVKRGIERTVVDSTRRQEKRVEALDEVLRRVETQVVALTEQSEGRRLLDEAEDAGTRKGRTFEEKVCRALDRIANARGDAASATGNEPGTGGSKKGDIVVEIGAGDGPVRGRIVFEVKDSRLTKPKAWAEMNGAMQARDAGFAVLVVAGEDKIPPDQQELHEYEGNKLIVAVDPEDPEGRSLELAYRYARCRLLSALEGDLTVDAAGVRVAAAEAKALLEEARNIKSSLTSAKNSVDRARTGVEGMVGSLLERLDRIESMVSAAEPAGADQLL